MHKLKLICRDLVQGPLHLLRLSRAVCAAIWSVRGKAGRDAVEAERLDRIRNPAKYLDAVNHRSAE
ncbi:MAG TPA: hypothetical protein VEH04_09745 [Verrucomicrobiae bacterium]|nr:hypothetical protein [Verrucomicrobiae bacterium]